MKGPDIFHLTHTVVLGTKWPYHNNLTDCNNVYCQLAVWLEAVNITAYQLPYSDIAAASSIKYLVIL